MLDETKKGARLNSKPHTRAQKLAPALTLLAAGLAITFTQTLHGSLTFNSWVFAVFGVLFAATVLLVRRPGFVPLAIVSAVSGIAAFVVRSADQLAIVIIVWAAVTAVIELLPAVRTRQSESLVLGVLAGLLAIVLAASRTELLMVVGFFASYAILAGVYLAIGAFDRSQTHIGAGAMGATQPAPGIGENAT